MNKFQTQIYHITYTPEQKQICLFFWGCNLNCKGCYCLRRIYSPMLEDFLGKHTDEPKEKANKPKYFLLLDELVNILSKYDFNSVILEGQEASLDPAYSIITKTLHEKFGSYNVLLSNGLQLPDLSHTDRVEIGLKAINDKLHTDYTGKSNSQILDNIRTLYKLNIDFFIESVVIPGYIDSEEIELISKFIANVDPKIVLILLPYFKSGDNPWRRPTPFEMEQIQTLAKKHLSKVFYFRGDEQLEHRVISLFPPQIDILVHHEPDENKTTKLGHSKEVLCTN
ncbi:MAG: radical SAM protein [Dehalococcoides mccartyi]|uniref:radical SAM protein n=1 Tax=Dehalococcoides mccartyi TaxID=61435 RepID=UPI0004E07B95|nr:radical SAM protein [Dehalococcoides mccartyi]AII59020.1 radical SAM protein [Dehalococcoides mccartyi CG4]